MSEWVAQWICITFCVVWTFLHGSYAADSEGHSYEQLVIGSFITTMQPLMYRVLFIGVFFDKTSNHPGDSAPLWPKFGTLWLLTFLKTKMTFERKEISNHQWDSGKYNGAADGNLEKYVRSQGAYFEGDWGIVLCTMFLVSSSIMSLFFILHGWILSRQTLYIVYLGHWFSK